MKLSPAILSTLLCAASASAQYFSAGWSPGQPADSHQPVPAYAFDPPAQEQPAAPAPPSPDAGADAPVGVQRPLGLVDKVLLSGPVRSLFGKFGMNMSDVVARGSTLPWDPRIPIITDENFEEMIVNEVMTKEEEQDRSWFVIITVTASQNSAVSKLVDQAFDDAYNQTVIAGDLPNLRWGRIDYMSVTYLTTKWAIWTGPYLVHITDRGQTLRFYRADRIRVSSEVIRELLTEELWRNTEPWNTNFAPGGKREFIMHYYAYGMQRFFQIVDRVPRFLLMIVSGAVASLVMRLLHKPPPEGAKTQPQPKPAAPSEKAATGSVASSTAVASAASASPSKSKGKSRKGGKK